jgi:hypothetical protein
MKKLSLEYVKLQKENEELRKIIKGKLIIVLVKKQVLLTNAGQ